MPYIRNLIILSLAFVTYVSAGCYTSGVTWGTSANRASASSALQSVCGQLAGDYSTSTTRSVCVNGGEGRRFNFDLENVGSASRSIGVTECVDGFNKEITGCDKGGSTSYAHWKYTWEILPSFVWCQFSIPSSHQPAWRNSWSLMLRISSTLIFMMIFLWFGSIPKLGSKPRRMLKRWCDARSHTQFDDVTQSFKDCKYQGLGRRPGLILFWKKQKKRVCWANSSYFSFKELEQWGISWRISVGSIRISNQWSILLWSDYFVVYFNHSNRNWWRALPVLVFFFFVKFTMYFEAILHVSVIRPSIHFWWIIKVLILIQWSRSSEKFFKKKKEKKIQPELGSENWGTFD